MRLRKPDCSPPSWEAPKQPEHTYKFEVELITPMYGGGVEAGVIDEAMPIRASSIRGQLRFWWRLLNPPSSNGNYKTLFETERKIWGGLGDGPEDLCASEVQVRVQLKQTVSHRSVKPCAEFKRNDHGGYKATSKFIQELNGLDYVLFPAQGKLSSDKISIETPPAKLLFPPFKFDLLITCKDKCLYKEHVYEALRWWASFGGLGARTRRGLGAVYVKGLNPITTEEAKNKGCRLVLQAKSENNQNNPSSAWKNAVDKLTAFRQGEGIGRQKKQAGNKTPGRSFWPEPDAIRRLTNIADGIALEPVHLAVNVFPRAFFGMPIIFHFKNIRRDNPQRGERRDERFDPVDSTLTPKGYERMASPLIVRPYATSQNKFVGCALKLPVNHLKKIELELKSENQPSPLPIQQWWPETPTISNSIPPMRGRGNDPLDAFLSYFSEK